jgi:membrane-bound lytic murein transglycosylase B
MDYRANTRQSFYAYKEAFKECIARPIGISDELLSKTVDEANFKPRKRIKRDRDRPPPSFREDYLSVYLEGDHRVLRGALAQNRHQKTLDEVEESFGVPGNVLMGLRCAETNCGLFFGEHSVIEAALTRAFIGRRENLFLGAAIHALQLIEYDVLEVDTPSSWAACVGQYQFLPFNFYRAAIDADGGGVDLFNSFEDATFSAANLLADKGWQRDKHIAFSLTDPGTDKLNRSHTGPWNARPLGEWMEMGIEFDGHIPNHAMDETVTMRNMAWSGDDEPFWLAFGENGRVIWRWNQSYSYVAAVHYLSQEIDEEAYRWEINQMIGKIEPAEPEYRAPEVTRHFPLEIY